MAQWYRYVGRWTKRSTRIWQTYFMENLCIWLRSEETTMCVYTQRKRIDPKQCRRRCHCRHRWIPSHWILLSIPNNSTRHGNKLIAKAFMRTTELCVIYLQNSFVVWIRFYVGFSLEMMVVKQKQQQQYHQCQSERNATKPTMNKLSSVPSVRRIKINKNTHNLNLMKWQRQPLTWISSSNSCFFLRISINCFCCSGVISVDAFSSRKEWKLKRK